MIFPLTFPRNEFPFYFLVVMLFGWTFGKDYFSDLVFYIFLALFALLTIGTFIYRIIRKKKKGIVIFREETIAFKIDQKEISYSYSEIGKIALNSYFFMARSTNRVANGADNFIRVSNKQAVYYFYIEDDLKYRVLLRFLKKKQTEFHFSLKHYLNYR